MKTEWDYTELTGAYLKRPDYAPAALKELSGISEATGRPSACYDFATFGSSFNVCDRAQALRETHRILKPGKYFACMWNHGDLEEPIQKRIEEIITSFIPEYGYGTRREDQSEVIAASDLFEDVRQVQGTILWEQSVKDIVEAWRSHSTLHRQAGDRFSDLVKEIAAYLDSPGTPSVNIPYTTRAWTAKSVAASRSERREA